MAKRGFSSTTSKFLWTIWRPADVSRALVTNPKYSKYLSVAQLDRIVFDSLGRKRFQVWWEKAGLLSFRVGWLADGGGHTGVVFRWSPVPHFFPQQSQPNILSVSSLFASVFLFFLLLPIYISIQCMDSIPPFIHPFQFPPFRAPARCIYQCPLIAGECFQTFKWLEFWWWWSWRLSWWWHQCHVGHLVRSVIY